MQSPSCVCAAALLTSLTTWTAFAAEDAPLAQLTFKNTGVVRREMQFEDKAQPCDYMETATVWSTPWNAHIFPYLYLVQSNNGARQLVPPPSGMRSAVPLGGLGAGTVELRADGSFHDWNIFNNSPDSGGGKVQLNDAFFGLRVKAEGNAARAWTLRTHPPLGLPPVAEIEYSGAFPVSRLRFRDPELPIKVELYAYSALKIRDPRASAAPAIVFSFVLSNPTPMPVDAAIVFNLPNHIQGAVAADNGLRIQRAGTGPVAGAMALYCGDGLGCSYAAGDDPAAIWKAFETQGRIGGAPLQRARAKYAAIASQTVLKSGESKTVNLILAWYFPNRMHGRQRAGNYYSKLWRSADDVAHDTITRLPEIHRSILQWQRLCFDNALPDWLQDALVNSVATMAKTGMWLEDGRWRQYESFSCPAVDPVHVHFYRSLPYVLFFPELQQSELRGYASIQKADGFINEDLGRAGRRMDVSQARTMGDCTSSFILGVYEQYLWIGDRQYLNELWPAAKKAAQWQINRSQRFGLPEHLDNTYDWWAFGDKDVVGYNAVLHLAAVQAAAKLADVEGDADFARACREAFATGQKKLDQLLWTGSHYRSWWMEQGGQTDALHVDTLYGQLWASLLGLGWVVEPDKARLHLHTEMRFNQSPFGLKVMGRRGRDSKPATDDLIWQAGSFDWATLNLLLGGDVKASLAAAKEVIDNWREHLRDQWDWTDTSFSNDGQPSCNSHYARQLIFWSIPLALSGQQYSAPEKKLSFSPRPDAAARLPWLIPGANGLLERLADDKYRMTVLSGNVALDELRVADARPVGNVVLQAGRSVDFQPGK